MILNLGASEVSGRVSQHLWWAPHVSVSIYTSWIPCSWFLNDIQSWSFLSNGNPHVYIYITIYNIPMINHHSPYNNHILTILVKSISFWWNDIETQCFLVQFQFFWWNHVKSWFSMIFAPHYRPFFQYQLYHLGMIFASCYIRIILFSAVNIHEILLLPVGFKPMNMDIHHQVGYNPT